MLTMKQFKRALNKCKKGTGIWKKFTKKQRLSVIRQHEPKFKWPKKRRKR